MDVHIIITAKLFTTGVLDQDNLKIVPIRAKTADLTRKVGVLIIQESTRTDGDMS